MWADGCFSPLKFFKNLRRNHACERVFCKGQFEGANRRVFCNTFDGIDSRQTGKHYRRDEIVQSWPFGLLFVLLPAMVATAADPQLDHANLLIYRNRHGEIVPVKSRANWQQRRAEILQAMQEVMGPLPGKAKRCPLDVKVEEEVDCGTCVRRRLTYQSEPGSRVPA